VYQKPLPDGVCPPDPGFRMRKEGIDERYLRGFLLEASSCIGLFLSRRVDKWKKIFLIAAS